MKVTERCGRTISTTTSSGTRMTSATTTAEFIAAGPQTEAKPNRGRTLRKLQTCRLAKPRWRAGRRWDWGAAAPSARTPQVCFGSRRR